MRFSDRVRRGAVITVAVALLVTMGAAPASAAPVGPTTAVSDAVIQPAADLTQFDPGQIISDQVFFDSNTMSVDAIQSFLNAQGRPCSAGYTCLRNWIGPSRSEPANPMCNAFQGSASETAASLIYKVARACGVNPQVILVTLQKEQGLVRSSAPSSYAYNFAMGYDCPDTTGCTGDGLGFATQVYRGTYMFKRYANPPGTSQYFTWYAPGRTWNVLYHPDGSRGCGSSPVTIRNQATANLYYYTPYQPNAAALRAGYGEGDRCSSYGNRNFFNYFTDWFGSTIGYTTSGAIDTIWREQGASAGWLGAPQSTMYYTGSNGGGWYQYFRGGVILVSQTVPSRVMSSASAITAQYMTTGGPDGWLGWPTGAETCGTVGCAVTYQSGTSVWSSRSGAIQQVTGAINADWTAKGGVNNPIGAPAGGMLSVGGPAPGWWQRFDSGYVFMRSGAATPSSLAATSGITQHYVASGGPGSALGWPTGPEVCGTGWCSLPLQNGTAVWSPNVGVISLTGEADKYWREMGGDSWIGAPIAPTEVAGTGTSIQRFRNATMYFDGGNRVVLRADSGITQLFEAQGGVRAWGWPRKGEECSDSGCATEFATVVAVWAAGTGLNTVSGAIRTEYGVQGGVTAWLGAAVTPMRRAGAGWYQDFAGGTIYVKQGGATASLRAESGLAQMYRSLGGPAGPLGYPSAAEVCDTRECAIVFDGGTLAWNIETGVISRR